MAYARLLPGAQEEFPSEIWRPGTAPKAARDRRRDELRRRYSHTVGARGSDAPDFPAMRIFGPAIFTTSLYGAASMRRKISATTGRDIRRPTSHAMRIRMGDRQFGAGNPAPWGRAISAHEYGASRSAARSAGLMGGRSASSRRRR